MPYSKFFSPKVCIVVGSPLHTLVFVLIWAAQKEFKFGEFFLEGKYNLEN